MVNALSLQQLTSLEILIAIIEMTDENAQTFHTVRLIPFLIPDGYRLPPPPLTPPTLNFLIVITP